MQTFLLILLAVAFYVVISRCYREIQFLKENMAEKVDRDYVQHLFQGNMKDEDDMNPFVAKELS
jgi:hypothetical protein